MLCIFCLQEKPERLGAGEHPIPRAVGGSWTIDRLCEDCDNRFGYAFDARLARVTSIAERREALNLAGNAGVVPNALSDALARGPVTVSGAPHHRMIVRPGANGAFNTRTIPRVEFDITPGSDGGWLAAIRHETFVIGMMPPEEARELIGRRLRAALEGRGIFFEDEVITEAARRMFDGVEVFERDITINVTREIVNGGYAASLLKAAYEAAWYWLGDEWLADAEAERIRQHLGGNESVLIRGALREGRIRVVNVHPTNPQHAHVIYLVHATDSLAVEVQLFDLFSVGVRVTETPERYCLPATGAIIMDPVARTYRELPSRALFGT